ncbi:MAG: uroporphyrinogen decarboxylase family protein [Lentisphaeria bacterium]|nr:uroporphyrinogen decarboxylase family protein [Lentisphaeria bacterium]
MKTLVTGRETLTSKERARAFFRGEETDRVPINMAWNPLIRKRVMAHFGAETSHELMAALGVDFMGVGARYAGPELFPKIPNRQVNPIYGWRTRWIEHGSGGYWDYCDFPLATATVDDIAAWPFANPADFDYSHIESVIDTNPAMGIHCGNPGTACIMNTIGFLRGMEQMFVDLITDDQAGLLLIDKLMDQQYGVMERTLEAGKGKIDFLWMGEDLGTQIAPLISKDVFRRHIRPRQQRFFDLAKRFDIPTLLHTCGSSSWAYEDYIEMGLTGVDTLQPEAADMSPAYLKKTFGGRLVFHGCVSSTGALSFGTPDDVEEDCRNVLKTMMPGGGYAFSPTHCLQDNTPLENVIRMYETAHQFGWY